MINQRMTVLVAVGLLLQIGFVHAQSLQISRFVDQDTIAILRLRTSSLPDAVTDRLGVATTVLPSFGRGVFRRLTAHPKIDEVYLLLCVSDLPRDAPALLAPRPDDWTSTDAERLVDQTRLHCVEIGDAIVIALPDVVERLRNLVPNTDQRSLQTVFQHNGPLQIVVKLSEDQRRVIRELGQPLVDGILPVDATLVANTKTVLVSVDHDSASPIRIEFETEGAGVADRLWASLTGLDEIFRSNSVRRLDSADDRLVVAVDLSDQWLTSTLDAWVADGRRQWARASLGKIALAFHNHHSAYKQLPAAVIRGDDGTPLLSWRVKLLPFLGPEQQDLWKRFHLDEPWDSPHNRTLISEMPDVFRLDPTQPSDGRSNVDIPAGSELMFHNENPKFRDVTDGLSNTIMAVTVPRKRAEIWTKPTGGLEIDAQQPLEGLGGKVDGKLMVIFGDGSVREIDSAEARGRLYGMFTRAGKERN